jgi:hypothetical protein
MVPINLTQEQKKAQGKYIMELTIEQMDVLENSITCDETSIFHP